MFYAQSTSAVISRARARARERDREREREREKREREEREREQRAREREIPDQVRMTHNHLCPMQVAKLRSVSPTRTSRPTRRKAEQWRYLRPVE